MLSFSSVLLLSAASTTVCCFSLHKLIGQAETSHSGPSGNGTAIVGAPPGRPGAEREHSRRRRAYYLQSQYPSWLISSEPPSSWMKGWLTFEHNRYRRMVPSTDMNMLYWSEELAASAQRHADRCDFRHSRDRVNVGENIWAAPYSNYSEAVRLWFEEVNDVRCQCSNSYKHCCGHFVQVVWARTNLVGCGYSRCHDILGVQGRGHRHVFVCHYNPQGNTVFVTPAGLYAVPAFKWASGGKGACSDCPEEAPACHEGLCYKPGNKVFNE